MIMMILLPQLVVLVVVVVEGKFTVLPNDQYGLYYRVVDAVPVK